MSLPSPNTMRTMNTMDDTMSTMNTMDKYRGAKCIAPHGCTSTMITMSTVKRTMITMHTKDDTYHDYHGTF